jgi:hypothetical protein
MKHECMWQLRYNTTILTNNMRMTHSHTNYKCTSTTFLLPSVTTCKQIVSKGPFTLKSKLRVASQGSIEWAMC